MGMFDRVWLPCACGGLVEFQTKAGDCTLRDYGASDLPPEIAADIHGEIERCGSCNTLVRAAVLTIVRTTVEGRTEEAP